MKVCLESVANVCHSINEAIRLHTMNPVGRENMRRTIDRYWF